MSKMFMSAVLVIGFGALSSACGGAPAPPAPHGSSAPRATNAGGYAVPDEDHVHVPDDAPLTHSHEPPSSGNHYATPLPAGTYPTAQPEGNWIHSLEHGYIVVVYRCSAAECANFNSQAQAIMAALPKDPIFGEVKFIATPYQGMAPKVAVLAWDREQDMNVMDQSLIAAFYKQYVDHGRESLP